jgi:hypothetical protein
VTVGQLAPGTAQANCNQENDWIQPTVTSGNSYVLPGAGTITSWSTNAAAGPDQMLAMKIFRKTGDPDVYTVVGHDGPRPLAGGLVNTFPASIPVKVGDLLGLNATNAGTTNNACFFEVPGESNFFFFGNLNDGQAAAFNDETGNRLNATAVFVPTNSFTVGGITRNKKKGTATITVNVPNTGELTASGIGAKAAGAAVISKAITGPSSTQLLIKAKGKKKRKLFETGKAKLNLAVTYTPTGGDPSTQSLKVKLRKKLTKR